jgi:hypothetical protein
MWGKVFRIAERKMEEIYSESETDRMEELSVCLSVCAPAHHFAVAV